MQRLIVAKVCTTPIWNVRDGDLSWRGSIYRAT